MRVRHSIFVLLYLLVCTAGWAVTLEELSFEELIRSSTFIVRGRVEGVTGVASSSGVAKAGGNSGAGTVAPAHVLYTEYGIRVTELLQGEGNPDRLTVALPGGRVGSREQMFSGVPALVTGKEYVFFLWRGRSGRLQLVGMTQGLLEVQRRGGVAMAERQASDGMLLSRRTGLPVHDRAVRMSLARLRSAVGAARTQGGAQR